MKKYFNISLLFVLTISNVTSLHGYENWKERFPEISERMKGWCPFKKEGQPEDSPKEIHSQPKENLDDQTTFTGARKSKTLNIKSTDVSPNVAVTTKPQLNNIIVYNMMKQINVSLSFETFIQKSQETMNGEEAHREYNKQLDNLINKQCNGTDNECSKTLWEYFSNAQYTFLENKIKEINKKIVANQAALEEEYNTGYDDSALVDAYKEGRKNLKTNLQWFEDFMNQKQN